jgi:hypothetical protein
LSVALAYPLILIGFEICSLQNMSLENNIPTSFQKYSTFSS